MHWLTGRRSFRLIYRISNSIMLEVKYRIYSFFQLAPQLATSM
jgi:hypothetical protein